MTKPIKLKKNLRRSLGMAKKAKWLEESTNQELLGEVLEKLSLGEDIEKKDINRAIKAVEELMERLPNEDESKISVEEALELLRGEFEKHISLVEAAYQAELDAMDGDEEDFEDEEDLDEEDEEDFEDEDGEDEDEEDLDEEDEDYSNWTVKELRAECRKRGISTKGLKKADMLELLLDEDKEDFDEDNDEDDYEDDEGEENEDEEDFDEEDEDEVEYSELSNKALKDLCRERGIKVRKGMKKADFIRALEADDEE